MSFFSDLRKLSQQGAAVRKQYPVQQQLATASAQMEAVSAMLQQATQQQAGGARLLTAGVDTVAVVTGARQSNALMNHNPMIELDLLVSMPTGVPPAVVPVPVRRTEVVQMLHLAKVQVGARLAVRVDPADPETLWINWSATPV